MTAFCPDGYVPTGEATLRAAARWHGEQLSSLQSAASVGSLVSPVDSLLWAAEKVRTNILPKNLSELADEVVRKSAHRMRNHLHRGEITAYFFGPLMGTPRIHAVESGFWATTEADGVLTLGAYSPFGKPHTQYAPTRSYRLFFQERELAALLSGDAESNAKVTTVIREGAHKVYTEPTGDIPREKPGPGALSRGIMEAIPHLWPGGVPKGLRAKDRNAKICSWLSLTKGYSVPANPARTIQRVLKQQKSR